MTSPAGSLHIRVIRALLVVGVKWSVCGLGSKYDKGFAISVYSPRDTDSASYRLCGRSSFGDEENVMVFIPSEFAIGGVFFPPLLIASILGVTAAVSTAFVLNRYRLSRFFFYPPMVFLALAIIYTGVIGTFFIPV